MRHDNLDEIRKTVQRLAEGCQPDPLARCIAEQLAIVLSSLLGLETIARLLAGADNPGLMLEA